MTNDAPTSNDPRTAWGDGLATITNDGQVLDAWFPTPALGPLPEGRDPHISPASFAALAYDDERRQVQVSPVTVTVQLDEPVGSVVDAYLRLHLLSHLVVEPNSINLDGIFGHLPTNAWTNVGPMRPELAASSRATLQREGIQVYAIDKFPRLLDYVMPADVRIADGGRVRLGAHLAPGTVVMHEGFVNFNAGTLGRSMVEGRVSQGSSSERAATSAAAHPSWARSRAAACSASESASAPCSERTPVSESPSVMTRSSRPACTSPLARRSLSSARATLTARSASHVR